MYMNSERKFQLKTTALYSYCSVNFLFTFIDPKIYKDVDICSEVKYFYRLLSNNLLKKFFDLYSFLRVYYILRT